MCIIFLFVAKYSFSKIGLALCATVIFMLPANAQEEAPIPGSRRVGPKQKPSYIVPQATLKFNVAALANIFRSSLFFSSDIHFSKNIVADVGIGWFFGSVLQENKGESLNGLRFRTGFKYVFLPHRKVAPYVGLEGKLNYLAEKDFYNLQRFGGQYMEIALLPRRTQMYGAAARWGMHIIPDKKRRFIMDLYMGVGFKSVIVDFSLPEDAVIVNFGGPDIFSFRQSPGKHILPDMLFGVSLGYCFHKKEK